MTRTGYRLLGISALAAVGLVAADVLVDYWFFYEVPLADVAVLGVPTFEIYFRGVIFAIVVGYGYATARVVSKRERLADEVRESQGNLDLLFQTLSDLLLVLAPSGAVLEANRAAERTLGLTADERRGEEGATVFRELFPRRRCRRRRKPSGGSASWRNARPVGVQGC